MWVARDRNGETCYYKKPYKLKNGLWNNVDSEGEAWKHKTQDQRNVLRGNFHWVPLPEGTIKKLIGRDISFDECIEIIKID